MTFVQTDISAVTLNGREYWCILSRATVSGRSGTDPSCFCDPTPNSPSQWVRDEFEHFWRQGVDLPDAVVKHIAGMAHRMEYRSIEAARVADGSAPVEAVLADRPIYKGGQILRPLFLLRVL